MFKGSNNYKSGQVLKLNTGKKNIFIPQQLVKTSVAMNKTAKCELL